MPALTPESVGEDRMVTLLRHARTVPEIYRRLQGAADADELFARAAEMARAECGFARGVVLTVSGRALTASHAMLPDEASDRLRRRVLHSPIRLEPGTRKAEMLRLAGSARSACTTAPSTVHDALGLTHWACGVIAPETKPLALLIVDRPDGAVDELDTAVVEAFAAMIAVALEVVILRGRIAEFGAELRSVNTFMAAMTGEMLSAPLGLAERGQVTVFPVRDSVAPIGGEPRAHHGLTDREATIAALLTEGLSNRDIAARLYVSPETVKMHVARILRKLNASNRVEVAARMLEFGHADRAAMSPTARAG